MAGLIAYGTYIPHRRLSRSAIAAALGTSVGQGDRAVASYDEDSTSMAVEAGRAAMATIRNEWGPDVVLLATVTAPYVDKTNATAVHAALGLPTETAAYDFGGSARSAEGALRFARCSSLGTLVTISDIRTGAPGGSDESNGGDAAVAFAVGGDPPLIEVLGEGSSSSEFLDRWRAPGELSSRVWEERFGEAVYVPQAQAAVTKAFDHAGIIAEDLDYLIVTGLHSRAVRTVRTWIGARQTAVVDDLIGDIGNTGASHPGLLLAGVLDRASAGETIGVVHLADGADVTIYRATQALQEWRAMYCRRTLVEQVAAGRSGLPYASFLTWRGNLQREAPRRPALDSPAAPPSRRNVQWKFGFEASRCDRCGTRHLPPARVCLSCHAVDEMSGDRLADERGTIVTYTVDRLAFSPSPPVVVAVIDFDGGGRYQCEVADIDVDEVAIGKRVEMTFRCLYTASTGVHDYFWKARLIQTEEET